MPRGAGSDAAATTPSRLRWRSPIPTRPIRRRCSSDPPREIRASSRLVLPRRRSSEPAATTAKRGRQPAGREGPCQAAAIGARIGNQCPTTRLWIN